MGDTKVISLESAPGEHLAWNAPRWKIYTWYLVEYLFVTNALQISSTLRVLALKLYGAKIGTGVIFRPRTRVKFPWNLEVGNDCWIGEGVWFHNQDKITIGNDVCISQDTFLTTGSHAFRTDMALITKPIVIEDGVWVAARCVVLGGTRLGASCLVGAGHVIKGQLLDAMVYTQQAPVDRF